MNSLTIAFWATLVALVLGSLAAAALSRYQFFGRNSLNLMHRAADRPARHRHRHRPQLRASPGSASTCRAATLVVAHATFCIVIVFNNVAARMRQLSPNLDEASADLGADQLQTFWHVRLPLLMTSLLAGGLLAFALSFDEIIVTTFTGRGRLPDPAAVDLPNMFRDTSLPLVNVTATFVVIVMIIPVYLAQRLSDTAAGGRT